MSSSEIIYGTNPVLEALKAGRRRCHQVFVSDGRREADVKAVEEEAARRRVPVKRVPREELKKLAETEKNQGVALRCDPFSYEDLEALVGRALSDERKGFLVVLDGVTDPQNLGSIVRTAHLMGVHGIIIPRDNAAGVTPTVVKSSAGATEYLPIAQVTNIAETLRYIKERGFW
ncbi:MAG TPA: RNA methyltransferase, partial [bacterium]|nr:RNA methyltransferase [bacterium]